MAILGLLHSVAAPVVSSAPVHLFCFSTLLGTQLYQSFVVTKVCFTALSRAPFVRLQRQLFPVYFRIQTLLLALTALTLPPLGPVSLAHDGGDWVPLLVGGFAALLNLFLFGPRTRQAMLDRHEQGAAIHAKDEGLVAVELSAVKRRFSKNHAACIHLNLVCIIVTLWHGRRLASRIAF
ncbi:putative mitochondrial outer membrane protein-like protein [Hapsidospora chrysogenum ATCC 11550]|uniref:Putative mitochondrial outer membrane protein-like protein n=1 Tax=Hapsidospora chrysogenum (strain ATCC 11550 / CBS 779.69 / DSM 880 / IAM 14645 / JCM 23072 / IMI 49137) TaxID=857340 RepID=A0A086T133_HAPC1|nr:putative mitochondrial outer membrane protein-like protein [Hapsidospora chrysogenum ATCC 11550]